LSAFESTRARVEDEIDKALNRKVLLKSGGYLIIDQTESMTTIDVNTGGFVGKHNLEETIFKTNLESAQAIARQLRLRNLGGIIIIDFIDMTVLEHRRQVLRALEKALERDHARTCKVCDGRGMQKTIDTVGFEVTREIIRQVRQFEIDSVTVLASSEMVEWFTEERSDDLAELQDFVGVPIRLQAEIYYTREHYDVVLQ